MIQNCLAITGRPFGRVHDQTALDRSRKMEDVIILLATDVRKNFVGYVEVTGEYIIANNDIKWRCKQIEAFLLCY